MRDRVSCLRFPPAIDGTMEISSPSLTGASSPLARMSSSLTYTRTKLRSEGRRGHSPRAGQSAGGRARRSGAGPVGRHTAGIAVVADGAEPVDGQQLSAPPTISWMPGWRPRASWSCASRGSDSQVAARTVFSEPDQAKLVATAKAWLAARKSSNKRASQARPKGRVVGGRRLGKATGAVGICRGLPIAGQDAGIARRPAVPTGDGDVALGPAGQAGGPRTAGQSTAAQPPCRAVRSNVGDGGARCAASRSSAMRPALDALELRFFVGKPHRRRRAVSGVVSRLAASPGGARMVHQRVPRPGQTLRRTPYKSTWTCKASTSARRCTLPRVTGPLRRPGRTPAAPRSALPPTSTAWRSSSGR